MPKKITFTIDDSPKQVGPVQFQLKVGEKPKVEFSKDGGLAEIYGSAALQYNLLDPKTLKGIHAPFKCKDFFQDLFWSEFQGHPCSIYGFSWEPGKAPWVKDSATLLIGVRFKEEILEPRLKHAQDFMNQFTEALGWQSIQLIPNTTGKIIIYEFQRQWIEKPVYISLLTLLMRLSLAYKGEDMKKFLDTIQVKPDPIGINDGRYVAQSRPVLDHILSGKKWQPKQEYDDFKPGSTSSLHNSSGIATFGPTTVKAK